MRGFIVSLSTVLIIAILFMGIMLVFSFFTGGARSTGLFGWGDQTLLAGVEDFVTGIYNSLIVVSGWVTITVLLLVFVGIQGAFVYGYYKLLKFALSFREDFRKILDELLDI
jgi:hypothetical protein